MAGLGFKDFQVGEVLTSSDVDGYLMQQAVMRFADAGARGSALGTAVGTAVALSEGMVAYLDDVDRVDVYTGTAWAPVSRIVQVVSTTKVDTFSTTSTSFTPVTGLSVSITPQLASSKVLVLCQLSANIASNAAFFIRLMRGATEIGSGTGAGSRRTGIASIYTNEVLATMPAIIHYIDSPATTSSTTYSIDVATNTGTIRVNTHGDDNNATTSLRSSSTITVMEVAA